MNPGQFIQQFNAATAHFGGKVVGCVITVYQDRTFDFEIKSPPAAVLIKEKAGIDKGSGVPTKEKVGKLTADDLREIAKEKEKELTGLSEEARLRISAGTARSRGVTVEGV